MDEGSQNTAQEETKPAQKADAGSEVKDDLPAPPKQTQADVDRLVSEIGNAVLSKLDIGKQVDQALNSRFAPKQEAPSKNPIHQFFEENPTAVLNEVKKLAVEEARAEQKKEDAENRKRLGIINDYVRRVPEIGNYPEAIEGEIRRVQAEYKQKHNALLDATEALPTALERTAKRYKLKKLTDEEVNQASLPGASGGYNPTTQKAAKVMSPEEYVKNLKQAHQKYVVRQA